MNDDGDALPLEPALSFLQRLWEVNHALERVSSRMEKRLGVSAPQRLLIRCIGKFPGITAGQMAKTLHLDPGTVSVALRRLERKGIIVRRRDPRDRRRVGLGLTASGRALDRPQEGTVEAAVVDALARATAAEIRATQAMLRALTAALERQASEESS